MDNLELQRRSLPNEPGVYFFNNKERDIIYIGKAKDLKKRVSSYFTKSSYTDPYYAEKITELRNQIDSIEVIVTENEKEALILENILIKKHTPRFNVFMRDSKSYPWVMITYSEEYPRIRIMRNPSKYNQKNLFLGPYTDKKEIQRILRDLRKLFPYCSCKRKVKPRDRPCLYYQLDLCPGPCIKAISKENYLEKHIKKIEMFLKGETTELMHQIKQRMEKAAEKQNYEIAAFWRDKLDAIENSTKKQDILLSDEVDKDIIGYFQKDNYVSMNIIHIREGRFTGKTPFTIDLRDKFIRKREILPSLSEFYYQNHLINLPEMIVIPEDFDNEELEPLKELLHESKESLEFTNPSDERETGLSRIANKNAKVMVKQEIEMEEIKSKQKQEEEELLKEVKNLLNLSTIPIIIEGFDISNIEGKNATGSMVYFLNGKPYKKYYRHYNIKSKKTPDDIAMMKEVLERRYRYLLKKNLELPDLILVDGGKGQLNAAKKVLENLGLSIPAIGLAKKYEEIFLKEKDDPIILPENSQILRLFQHIRDEAHRFAVRLHKKQRQKQFKSSALEDIKGIGPKTRTKLLRNFGSLNAIKNASLEEISKITNERIAKKIRDYFS
ncbi:MAG: excinuclease ABC subunit UvrC [Promethearchaeota archaeon]|nr:MAG: excinuclease ABC subunit UvrC [Candidatus Lokiarchaeota archaeon]